MRENRLASASSPAPEVTIIVPVYNGAATIAACVSSLLALRHPKRFEIIVVDNASSDGTRAAVQAFGDDIRMLTEATRGASAARNRGIRDARGTLIAFTDADCVVEPDWLSALVSPLGDPGVGVVGGRILSRIAGNRIERFGETIHDHQRAIERENPPYAITMNWASRRDVLCEAGLFEETLLRGQDVDLTWRIHRLGYRLVYASNAIVRHRNEHTLWGLTREGYVHGLHGVALRDRLAVMLPEMRGPWTSIAARFAADLRRLVRGTNRIDGLLRILFDCGKATGELVALARSAERQ